MASTPAPVTYNVRVTWPTAIFINDVPHPEGTEVDQVESELALALAANGMVELLGQSVAKEPLTDRPRVLRAKV